MNARQPTISEVIRHTLSKHRRHVKIIFDCVEQGAPRRLAEFRAVFSCSKIRIISKRSGDGCQPMAAANLLSYSSSRETAGASRSASIIWLALGMKGPGRAGGIVPRMRISVRSLLRSPRGHKQLRFVGFGGCRGVLMESTSRQNRSKSS
jgi:hypothetical protein